QRVDTIYNLPRQRMTSAGPWTEQFSSNGRRYFYNRETEISQWDKPAAWIKAEEIVDPEVDNDNCDRLSSFSELQDRCGSSPEKIDVSDDENSPMEEEVDEEEQKRRKAETERIAAEEKERNEKEKEYNKYYGYRRFIDDAAMDLKYKQMFGSERIVRPYSRENYPFHLARRVEDLSYTIDFDEKMLEASRHRRRAETALYTADFFQRKCEGLRELSKELEERHQNFQNNFEATMGTLVAQAKNGTNFGSDNGWSDWPSRSEDKIVEHHESVLARRSEEYQEKRARFLERYKPKPPTPSPSPEPLQAPGTSAVILDEKKLRELEVRSPSPSYEEEDMEVEMVVSPVYEDEYDPTARAVPSYSSRSLSPSSARSSNAGNDSLRTQEYTRPSTECPLPVEYILEPPPAFPILAPLSPNPVISPVASPLAHFPRSPAAVALPLQSPLISPARSPPYNHHPRSPEPSVRSPIIAADHPTFPHPFHPHPPVIHPMMVMDPTMIIFDPTVPPPSLPPFLPPPPPAPILDQLFEECEMKKDPFYRKIK
ncbi:hypothetical protein PENTCL1PPCAC_28472, partial [Pristionchus entomophagus]